MAQTQGARHSAKTGGVEIDQMRGLWAELQNRALERAGEVERVDHRSLEAQREAALEQGDDLTAEELDRDPEFKGNPVIAVCQEWSIPSTKAIAWLIMGGRAIQGTSGTQLAEPFQDVADHLITKRVQDAFET